MTRIFVTLLVTLLFVNANAQLSNTKWKGTLNINGGMDVSFNFGSDTLEVSNAESGESLETMKYTTADSVLTLEKLYGNSQCDTTAGRYKYLIADKKMTLSIISDDCPDRSSAIGTMKLDEEEVSQ